ncbi:MAG TPA: hypothetical protein VGZ23_13155 [bacterium]|nr:hypothetical protein [bacterium]
MTATARPLIGVVGDLDPANPTHRFTNEALAHADAEHAWVATDAIGPNPQAALRHFAGLLIAPGSPYRDMDGAIAAVRYARERGVPLVGT